MATPAGWTNPMTSPAGQRQRDIDASQVLPSRAELEGVRLNAQRQLLASGQNRFTPIQVTEDGVIWDGHHGARAAAEMRQLVEVLVVAQKVRPVGLSILNLPVR
jgi:hypothetical protein